MSVPIEHRHSQDFVWGCTFFLQNADLFSSSPSTNGLKLLNKPPNIPRPAKTLPGGALGVLRGALTNFPCKLRLIFFTALAVHRCRCTHCTPGYAHAIESRMRLPISD